VAKFPPSNLIDIEIGEEDGPATAPGVQLDSPRLAYRTVREAHPESTQALPIPESLCATELQRGPQSVTIHTLAIVEDRDRNVRLSGNARFLAWTFPYEHTDVTSPSLNRIVDEFGHRVGDAPISGIPGGEDELVICNE